MDSLLQDVKAAFRALRTRKGMVALAVATLALAIGANTSIFGVVHAVLLDQLPYRDPERLAIVWAMHVSGEREVLSVLTVEDYQAQTRTLERMAAWFEQGVNLTGEGDPERLLAARVSAGFFDVLGAPAALGRTFTPDEYGGGGAHVTVLSDALWRRRFGADPSVVGRSDPPRRRELPGGGGDVPAVPLPRRTRRARRAARPRRRAPPRQAGQRLPPGHRPARSGGEPGAGGAADVGGGPRPRCALPRVQQPAGGGGAPRAGRRDGGELPRAS